MESQAWLRRGVSRGWQSFAEWTSLNQAGASEAFLLWDAQDANRHISFGPWRSEDDISAWRATPEFTAFVGKVRELCDDFQPNTVHQVGHVAGARTVLVKYFAIA
jgi:heme-degrading monooxygenase HmoA